MLARDLPPPLDDSEAARIARDQAAIAEAASMRPATAEETDLAAHCVLARAWAGAVLQEMNAARGNLALMMQLGRQYALMERTANANRSLLSRVQADRQKREAQPKLATTDEWSEHIALRRLQEGLEQTQPPAAVGDAKVPRCEPPALHLVEDEPAPAAGPREAAAAPLRRRQVQQEEPQRDLAAEAKDYAIIYPQRAQLIRRHGGLPPLDDFPPPDDELVQAIVDGNDEMWYELDYSNVAAAE